MYLRTKSQSVSTTKFPFTLHPTANCVFDSIPELMSRSIPSRCRSEDVGSSHAGVCRSDLKSIHPQAETLICAKGMSNVDFHQIRFLLNRLFRQTRRHNQSRHCDGKGKTA